MNFPLRRFAIRLFVAVPLAAASVGHAQEWSWSPFVSITPVYEGDADLDRGGDFNAGGVLLRAGATRDLGSGNRAGVTFNYDYFDFSFSNPVSFGGVAPWNIVQRYGVTVPLSFALRDGWSLGIAPSVDWFKENGADTGESLTWGATLSATRVFEGGNRLGIGVAAFKQIEENVVFPVLIVNWRLSERWRLVNPLTSGPTGGAGLELDYQFDSGWTAGVGLAYRILRFRLSEKGPVPNGVGEERGVPVFVRVTHDFSKQMSLNLYAGVVAGGRLRVEDPSGNVLREDDFDPAPLFALTLVGRF